MEEREKPEREQVRESKEVGEEGEWGRKEEENWEVGWEKELEGTRRLGLGRR